MIDRVDDIHNDTEFQIKHYEQDRVSKKNNRTILILN